MSNVTLSSSANYDASAMSALTNGDNITINSGAVLTIDSDVRWGQNAAVFGDITVTEGSLTVDATNTWWIPYDGGTGNVPTLGTVGTPDVTRSGSNVGEFLGIFTALGVAPSAAAGAMPATGFVKLRTKSVTFSDNDVLTFAGGATATVNSTTGGQRGWIHLVGEVGTSSTTGRTVIPRLGSLTINGDWFELGTSNGTSGQTFQHYVSDYVPAIQVETGSGTGVYEWWGNSVSGDFSATNFSTDSRSPFFTCSSAGVITFGGATYGKLPPNGAKIRVPNIHVSNSSSTDWTANILPATITNRYAFVSTGGSIDARYVCCIGSFGSSNAPLYQIKYSCGADGCWNDNQGIGSVTGVSQIRFDSVASGRIAAVNNLHFGATYCSDIVLNNCWSFQSTGSGSNTGCFYFTNCTDVTFTSCGMFTNKTVICWEANYCNNITLTDCIVVASSTIGATMSFTGSTNIIINDIKITSKMVDTQTAISYGMNIIGCTGVVVDGISLFSGTTIPIFNFVNATNQTNNIRIRNIGTRAAPIALGSAGRYIIAFSNVSSAYISRCYSSGGSQTADSISLCSSCDNVVISDCGDPTSYTTQSVSPILTKTAFFKRTASGGSKSYASTSANGTTQTNETAFGTHFLEQEVSSTEVWLTVLCGTEKSSSPFSTSAYTDDVGTIKRDGSNGLMLVTLNDQVTWTWTYWIRGITAFPNTAPAISGTNTGNFTLQYDLDKGTGFSGTFKTLSAANLSAETSISATGVRLKIRAICATANSANLLKAISVYATTSSSDITSNYYPYNEPLVSVTGGLSSTYAGVFDNTTGKLLSYANDSSLINLYPEWYSDAASTLRIRKAGYYPIEATFTLTEAGLTYPISQIDSPIADTDHTGSITVTNHGASPVTWQSKSWSITITVTDSSTAAQIAQHILYTVSNSANAFGSTFSGLAWPEMIVPSGTSFETSRGTLFGSAGAALKGVRVVDGSDNMIAGFTRMQADDGTYYTPPASVNISVTTDTALIGAQVYVAILDTAGLTEATYTPSNIVSTLINTTSSGATTTVSYVYTVDKPVRVVVRKSGYVPFVVYSTITSAGLGVTAINPVDGTA